MNFNALEEKMLSIYRTTCFTNEEEKDVELPFKNTCPFHSLWVSKTNNSSSLIAPISMALSRALSPP